MKKPVQFRISVHPPSGALDVWCVNACVDAPGYEWTSASADDFETAVSVAVSRAMANKDRPEPDAAVLQ